MSNLGTCMCHDGVHKFRNDPTPCLDWVGIHSKFDEFGGYYSVMFSGIEFARYAPSPVWTEYAKMMSDVPDFSYTFVTN